MANGAHALPLELESPSAPAAHTPKGIEIGEAVADGVIVVAHAMTDFETIGALAPKTRELGGNALAHLALLRLNLIGEALDFDREARMHAPRVILERHGAFLRRHYGEGELNVALGQLISWTLEISSRAVADELALRTN
jgi:hypothetical protein